MPLAKLWMYGIGYLSAIVLLLKALTSNTLTIDMVKSEIMTEGVGRYIR